MIVLESVARLFAFILAVWAVGASARSLLCSSIFALAVELVLLLWQARRSLPLSDDMQALDRPAHVLRTTSALAGGAASNTVQLQAYRVIFPAAGHSNTAAALGVTANIGAVAMSACAQVFRSYSCLGCTSHGGVDYPVCLGRGCYHDRFAAYCIAIL